MKTITSLLGFTLLLLSQVVSLDRNAYAGTDIKSYKNFYGIAWSGKPEEDVKYAKQMGYDYIVINPSSSIKDYHDNPDCTGLKFYLVDPFWYPEVISGNNRYIDTMLPVSEASRSFYNEHMVWKSNDTFPNNLATGYHPLGSSTKFSVMWDFQQQAVIDEVVEKIVALAKKYENTDQSFTFGGYIMNEPKLAGAFYRLDENGKNTPVSLPYWTGMDSGLIHGAITHEYATYSEGMAALYKKLRARISQEFSGAKWIVQPTWLYNEIDNNEWIYQIKDRADKEELTPHLLSQGSSQNTNFVDDANNFNSGVSITKENVGNSQSDDIDEYKNRLLAAKAAINGAWFNWFGQFGNSGETPYFKGITEVYPRLKLIRCLPNWDNLNNVPLNERSWNGKVYQSTRSYASSDVLYSRHPKTGKLFAVFLTMNGTIKLNDDETVASVHCTDDLLVESEDALADFTMTRNEIRLKNREGVDKGYIIELSNASRSIASTGATNKAPNVMPDTMQSPENSSDTSGDSDTVPNEIQDNSQDKDLALGPLALAPAEWKQVPIRTAAQKAAGLSGGEGTQLIYTIAYAPSNPNMVYLTSDTSQVWKSADGGANWKIAHSGFPAKGGISLAVDPRNENIVFVAGSVHTVNRSIRSKSSGIYRTKDGGATWKQVRQTHYQKPSPAEKGGVHFAFGSSSSIVYAGTHDQGLLKSTNGGDTWISLNVFTTQQILDVKVHPADSSVLFVSTSTGLYKVTVNGSSAGARKVGAGLPTYPHTVVINPKDPRIMYASVRQHGIYMSNNGGDSFSPRNNGLTDLKSGKRASYLSISPVDPNYLYASFYSSSKVYYSHNGGANWYSPTSMDDRNAYGYVSGSMVNSNLPSYIGYLAAPTAFHPNDKNVALIAGNSYHIKKTTDGGVTWRFRSSGYTGAAVAWNSRSISWDPHNPNRFAFFLTDYGPYLTEDGGSTFRTLNVPKYGDKSTPVGALDPASGSKVIVTAAGEWYTQAICVSRNDGQTWTQITRDSSGNSTIDNYKFIAFHPQNANVIYAGQFKSTDKGYTWRKLPRKIAAMYPKDGNVVYSTSNNNGSNVVYKSTDGGVTWTNPFGSFRGSTGTSIVELAVDATNPNRLYAAVDSSGVFVWDGSRWIEKTASSGLTRDWFGRQQTQTIAVDPKHANVIYVGRAAPTYGQSNGVFRSTDYGATWQNVSFNIGPEININAISVNPVTGYAYAGSYHGVWKLPPPYTNTADVTPPVIHITSPTLADTYTSNQNTISLGGTASDNVSVTSITWANDRGNTGTANGTTNWTIPGISLSDGENIITVTARDAANNTETDRITVMFSNTNTNSLVANKTSNAITIDGKLSESVWNLSQTADKVIEGSPDNEVSFGATWDAKNLYVGAKVLDNKLYNDSGDPWQDDAVEVYLDANHNKGTRYDTYDRQFMKGYNDAALFSKQVANVVTQAGVLHSWAPIPGGYTVEIAIPWSNLGITPSEGKKIGFDIQNDDDDNGGNREHVQVWSGIKYNYRDTSSFGNLILSSETDGNI